MCIGFQAVAKFEATVERIKADGGRILCGGRRVVSDTKVSHGEYGDPCVWW
jgi:hypothetical protein